MQYQFFSTIYWVKTKYPCFEVMHTLKCLLLMSRNPLKITIFYVLTCLPAVVGAVKQGNDESHILRVTPAEKSTGTAYAGMVLIPAGPAVIGSSRVDESRTAINMPDLKPWYLDEHPVHEQTLKAFYLDRYEVTNSDYRRFVASTKKAPPHYWGSNGYIISLRKTQLYSLGVEELRKLVEQVLRKGLEVNGMERSALLELIEIRLRYLDRLPVTNINWHNAKAYCHWLNKRLPSENEWEKAARGQYGSEFPWGEQWIAWIGNVGLKQMNDGVAPVGSHLGDVSSYGIFDLSGNVSEWTASWYLPYTGSDYMSSEFGERHVVVRGASWRDTDDEALKLKQRGAFRAYQLPDAESDDIGFRCAADIQTAID